MDVGEKVPRPVVGAFVTMIFLATFAGLLFVGLRYVVNAESRKIAQLKADSVSRDSLELTRENRQLSRYVGLDSLRATHDTTATCLFLLDGWEGLREEILVEEIGLFRDMDSVKENNRELLLVTAKYTSRTCGPALGKITMGQLGLDRMALYEEMRLLVYALGR